MNFLGIYNYIRYIRNESIFLLPGKVDFVMILDGSGSICNNQGGTCANWLATLKFVNDVVNGMAIGPDDSRVALITFGSIGNLIWPLDK